MMSKGSQHLRLVDVEGVRTEHVNNLSLEFFPSEYKHLQHVFLS